jgi:hypothetical protein
MKSEIRPPPRSTEQFAQPLTRSRPLAATTDLHATLPALMGLDHEKTTYRYAGRDFRLTDVAGNVATPIFAGADCRVLVLTRHLSA